MHLWRRIAAIVMAAVMTASPVFACADSCPESRPAASNDSRDISGSSMPRAMHEGCEDGGDSLPAPTTSHDEDCTGCPDCDGAMAVKTQALAAAAAISVDAPTNIVLSGPLATISQTPALSRWRLTPPAVGPPLASTPVSLKNILRI